MKWSDELHLQLDVILSMLDARLAQLGHFDAADAVPRQVDESDRQAANKSSSVQ